jgi:histone deacetylase 1/2
MENSNSLEYLEKIKAAVIDNLRQTGPAPSVQMQDVPRQPFGGMTEEEEAALNDLDEDENKDERMTDHRWDKRLQNEAEFEESDDEGAAANGLAPRRNGAKRTFNDFRNSDMEVDSGIASPANGVATEEPSDKTRRSKSNDAEDVAGDAEKAKKEASDAATKESETSATDAKKNSKVDEDGDVRMEDQAEETTIKKEDDETEPIINNDREPSSADAAEAGSGTGAAANAEPEETGVTDSSQSKEDKESGKDKGKDANEVPDSEDKTDTVGAASESMDVDKEQGADEGKKAKE